MIFKLVILGRRPRHPGATHDHLLNGLVLSLVFLREEYNGSYRFPLSKIMS